VAFGIFPISQDRLWMSGKLRPQGHVFGKSWGGVSPGLQPQGRPVVPGEAPIYKLPKSKNLDLQAFVVVLVSNFYLLNRILSVQFDAGFGS